MIAEEATYHTERDVCTRHAARLRFIVAILVKDLDNKESPHSSQRSVQSQDMPYKVSQDIPYSLRSSFDLGIQRLTRVERWIPRSISRIMVVQ